MITLDNITFSYTKGRPAIIDANASMMPGIQLLIGPNGAGKTTLMKIISGILLRQKGDCLIEGEIIERRKPSELECVFFLPEDCIFPLPTINDMAERHAPFYPDFSADLLYSNLEAFGLKGDEKLSDLSLGDRKKANVSYALALGTEVLLLDEPANGLDIASKKTLNRMIASCASDDRYIIIATHTVHEMQNLFDGVTMINHGHIVLSANTDDILSKLSFVTSPQRLPAALYEENSLSGWRSIIENSDGIDSHIDYVMLYSALVSDKAPAITNLFS